MNENEILGFDPTQLDVLNPQEKPQSAGNPLIYKTSPAKSKSEDGRYRCTIKVVYNPFDLRKSVLEQQSYGLQDKNGWFSVISSLTNNDTSCPIFKAWKKCHFADPKKDEASKKLWLQAAKKEDGGYELFDKRFARYVVVQVLEDKNQPEVVGKFLFWKMPKTVWDIIQSKMSPSVESKKPKIPVMDFLFGRSIDLEVIPGEGEVGSEKYNRDTKYIAELSEDVVSCTNPDGSPLLNDNDQEILDNYVSAIKKVWKEKDPVRRAEIEAEVNADPNTSALRDIYSRVLEQIKSFCPNLIKELGYNEWNSDVVTRVHNWITVVLSCNDPATVDVNDLEVIKNGGTPSVQQTQTTQKTVTSTSSVSSVQTNVTQDENTDDLPF